MNMLTGLFMNFTDTWGLARVFGYGGGKTSDRVP